MHRASVRGNSRWNQKLDACRFFQAFGFLASGGVQAPSTADLRGTLAAPVRHGFMATPSGKNATPDTVATTVLVAVLITETLLGILLET
jgi:hypothetical protein